MINLVNSILWRPWRWPLRVKVSRDWNPATGNHAISLRAQLIVWTHWCTTGDIYQQLNESCLLLHGISDNICAKYTSKRFPMYKYWVKPTYTNLLSKIFTAHDIHGALTLAILRKYNVNWTSFSKRKGSSFSSGLCIWANLFDLF